MSDIAAGWLDQLVIGANATRPGWLGPNAYQDIAEACDAVYETDDGHPLEDAHGRMPYMTGYSGPRRLRAAGELVDVVAERRAHRRSTPADSPPAQEAA